MEKHLTNIASGLSSATIAIIIVMAIVTVIGFINVIVKTSGINKQIESDKKKGGKRRKLTRNGYQIQPDSYSWENTLDCLEEFNKIKASYGIFVQFITIFPLLGILGTVSGLMSSLADNASNIENIASGLGDALLTTFLGLIAAIVLKVFDAVFVSKKINDLELYFDMYEQNYEIAKDKTILGVDDQNDDKA